MSISWNKIWNASSLQSASKVQMVKTIYVGVYNIFLFHEISEIRIISQKVRFGSAEPQKWRFGAPLLKTLQNLKLNFNQPAKCFSYITEKYLVQFFYLVIRFAIDKGG